MLKLDLPKASKMKETLFRHSSQYQLPTPMRLQETELRDFYGMVHESRVEDFVFKYFHIGSHFLEFSKELTADAQVINHFIQNFQNDETPVNTKVTDALLLSSLGTHQTSAFPSSQAQI